MGANGAINTGTLLPLWRPRLRPLLLLLPLLPPLPLLPLLPPAPAPVPPAALLGKLIGAMAARVAGKNALAGSDGEACVVPGWSSWCCCSRCMKLRMGECSVQPTPAACTVLVSEALAGADTELRINTTPGGEGNELEERVEEGELEEWEECGGSDVTTGAEAGAEPEPEPADAWDIRSTASCGSVS